MFGKSAFPEKKDKYVITVTIVDGSEFEYTANEVPRPKDGLLLMDKDYFNWDNVSSVEVEDNE